MAESQKEFPFWVRHYSCCHHQTLQASIVKSHLSFYAEDLPVLRMFSHFLV